MARLKLRLARIESRLTQAQLSEKIGVSQQTIAKWERGKTTPAHFEQIRALEKTLDKPASELFPDVFGEQPPLAN